MTSLERYLKRREESEAKAKAAAVKRKAAKEAKILSNKLARKNRRAKVLEAERDVRQLESALSLKTREIISRRWQGQSAKQISDVMGFPISRIRQLLKEHGLRDTRR